MVGILVSFWEGLFSGDMFVSGRVISEVCRLHQTLHDVCQLQGAPAGPVTSFLEESGLMQYAKHFQVPKMFFFETGKFLENNA